jgi:hypothetical protein
MPRKRRPVVILVMAIINMVMGGLILICGMCAGSDAAILTAAGGAPGPGGAPASDMKTFLDNETPGWEAVLIGYAFVQLVLAVVLVAAGIGLLKMQSWARWLSVFYSAIALVLALAFTVFVAGFMGPARVKYQERQMNLAAQPASAQAGFQFGKTLGQSMNVICYGAIPIIHAIILAIVMLLPAVGEAFAPPRRRRSRTRDEDDLDEDEDDDRGDLRRRRGRAYDDRDDDDDNRFRRRPRGRDYDDYD